MKIHAMYIATAPANRKLEVPHQFSHIKQQ